MPLCFFVSDLHGDADRYRKLFDRVAREKPAGLFLGGDLLPCGHSAGEALDIDHGDFVNDFLVRNLERLAGAMGEGYPRVFVILGNDDCRSEEAAVVAAEAQGVWEYVHDRRASFAEYDVYGYACVPPTPFLLKDWERYDVSRHVDPGCVSPEEGYRSPDAAEDDLRFATIKEDLDALVGPRDLKLAIMLFHAPPYKTKLDRAALDGKMVDHVPLDVHVGSVAIRRFIKERRPLITLHGHVHESARITGAWSQRIGRTWCYSAARDGPELALIRFDPAHPGKAARELV